MAITERMIRNKVGKHGDVVEINRPFTYIPCRSRKLVIRLHALDSVVGYLPQNAICDCDNCGNIFPANEQAHWNLSLRVVMNQAIARFLINPGLLEE